MNCSEAIREAMHIDGDPYEGGVLPYYSTIRRRTIRERLHSDLFCRWLSYGVDETTGEEMWSVPFVLKRDAQHAGLESGLDSTAVRLIEERER